MRAEGNWRLVHYRGTWCAYRRDEANKPLRRSLGTTDKSLAEIRFAAFVSQETKTEKALPQTVGDVVDAYIAHLEPGSTTRQRQEMTKRGIERIGQPNLLALPADAFTAQHCRDYRTARLNQGFSDGTVLVDLGMIRTAYNWARKENLVSAVPGFDMPPKPPARQRWLTQDEAQRLIDACEWRYVRLFVLVALHTCARMSAILELRWSQVNSRFIDLRQPDMPRRAKGRAVVPMNPVLWEALEDARKQATSEFVIERGGHDIDNIKRAVKAAARRAGLGSDVTSYTLRHTGATWMAQADVPLWKIAGYLGHSSTKMVEQVYAKHSPTYLQGAGDAIVKRLAG